MRTALATRPGAADAAPPGTLPRLLSVRTDGHAPRAGYRLHTEALGPSPRLHTRGERNALLANLTASGLTGRGGGGFPTAKKIAAVRWGSGRRVAVANATEGEPLSHKDGVLLRLAPNLVIDGLVDAARAVQADTATLVISRGNDDRASIEAFVDLRARMLDDLELTVEAAPERFVVGEETALVNWLNGGPAKPTTTPPRPSERGVRGRPTLVQNAETLAHLALVSRFGADWFRQIGTPEEPGSVLVSVSGCVARPSVLEIAIGTPLAQVIETLGGATEPVSGYLVGGYFGTWVNADEASSLRLERSALRAVGASLGAGTIGVFPARSCPVFETARILRYLAAERAQQCGPCTFGLPAIAAAMHDLALCRQAPRSHQTLRTLVGLVEGRGACALPDGAARLVRSLFRAFDQEIARHLDGRCHAIAPTGTFPIPRRRTEWT